MQNIAIVVEYNPMHNGHIHQINRIKELYPDSSITVIMSGTFVQRGDYSILNKFQKAEIAIKNGVDLVIEMPTVISLQSADNFAFFNVAILDKLKNIDYLAFGIEAESIDEFNKLYEFYSENKKQIHLESKKYINEGLSFKVSFNRVVKELAIKNNLFRYELLSHPNNTLAIQYMDALIRLGSNIKSLPIIRDDSGYHSSQLDDKEFQSATTIRNMFRNNEDFSNYVPLETITELNKSSIKNIDSLSNIFNYLVRIEEKSADEITGYENGLENLIINNYKTSLSETIENIHNKRYSKSRISRFIVNYILGINNKDVENLNNINFIRPLKFNDKGAQVLKKIKENEDINIITKLTDSYNLDEANKSIIEFDKKAYLLQYFDNDELKTLDYRSNPKM